MPEQQQTLTIQQAIDLGVQHHTAGRLPEAEGIYRQILKTVPDQSVTQAGAAAKLPFKQSQ